MEIISSNSRERERETRTRQQQGWYTVYIYCMAHIYHIHLLSLLHFLSCPIFYSPPLYQASKQAHHSIPNLARERGGGDGQLSRDENIEGRRKDRMEITSYIELLCLSLSHALLFTLSSHVQISNPPLTLQCPALLTFFQSSNFIPFFHNLLFWNSWISHQLVIFVCSNGRCSCNNIKPR